MSDVRLQVIDSTANFSCGGCTRCCTQPYAVIIEKEKADALTRHDFSAHSQLAGQTLFRADKHAPAGYYVLSKQPGSTRCIFLADDGLCLIHKELGAAAKPHPCLKFPYHVSPTYVDDRVSLDFGCPHVQKSEGQALVEQRSEIAEICKVSKVRVYTDAVVDLLAGVQLNHDAYDALMQRLEGIFADPGNKSIWDRFAAALWLVQSVAQMKREGVADLVDRIQHQSVVLAAADVPPVTRHESAGKAPSPVRMMFAATLLRDVLPPDVTLNMSLWGRVRLLPRLMSLAKLSGRYESKLLGREIDVEAVLSHELEPELDPAATFLLCRYFRTRLWQRFLVGTRLSVVAGLHQHIQDQNALLFLARAEAHHRGASRLSEPLIAQGLAHVELNIANQPRVFDQKSLTWFTGQLDNPALALESLRLMSLVQAAPQPATAVVQSAR
jgi:Fe-S-cluster containining protein